jgi:Smg protein
MFDILVYVFHNYFQPDACPEPEQLARKLSAAGFEDDDITEAIEWLSGLQDAAGDGRPRIATTSASVRCYSPEELSKLSSEARGFLHFLVGAGVLNALTREIIIERAMAMNRPSISVARLKVIVLMVLWSRHESLDTLILEELLAEDDGPLYH